MKQTNKTWRGLLACFALNMAVQTAQADLILTFADGTTANYAVSGVQKLTFANGALQVTTSGNTTTHALSSLKKLSFGDVTTNIKPVGTKTEAQVTLNGSTLSVSGARGGRLRVFTIDGRQVMNEQLATDNAQLSAHDWAAGVYVVQVGSNSVKIVKQ